MKRPTTYINVQQTLDRCLSEVVRVLLCVATALLFVGEVHAVALGELSVRSALGQPLHAEVDLLFVDSKDLGSIKAGLADASVFKQLNIPRLALLSSLDFEIVTADRTKPYVSITSNKPVNEPFLNLLLEIDSAEGALVNEIVILLDPVVQGTNTSKGSTAEMSRSTPAVGAANPTANSANSNQMRVRKGDSLLTIVRRLNLGRATGAQASVAIYDASPQAFDGSIHRLQSGAMLTIPSERDMLAYSQKDALSALKKSLPAVARNKSSTPKKGSGKQQAKASATRGTGFTAEKAEYANTNLEQLSVLTESGVANPGAVVLISNESLGDIKALIVNLQGNMYDLQGELDERIDQLDALNTRVDELLSVADQIVTVAPNKAAAAAGDTRSLTVEEARALLLAQPRFESADQPAFDAKAYSEQELAGEPGEEYAEVEAEMEIEDDGNGYLQDLQDLEEKVGDSVADREALAAFVTARRHGRDFLPEEPFGEAHETNSDMKMESEYAQAAGMYTDERELEKESRWADFAAALEVFRETGEPSEQVRETGVAADSSPQMDEEYRDNAVPANPGLAAATRSANEEISEPGGSSAKVAVATDGWLQSLPQPLQDMLPQGLNVEMSWQRLRDVGLAVLAISMVLMLIRGRSRKTTVVSDAIPASMDPDEALDFYMNQIGNDELKEEVLKSVLKDAPERQDIRLQLMSKYADRREAGLFAETAQEMYRLTKGKNEEWYKVVEMGLGLDPNMRFYEGTNVIRFDLEADLGLSEEDRVESIRGGTSPGSQPYAVSGVSFDDFQPTDGEKKNDSVEETADASSADAAGPDFKLDAASMGEEQAADAASADVSEGAVQGEFETPTLAEMSAAVDQQSKLPGNYIDGLEASDFMDGSEQSIDSDGAGEPAALDDEPVVRPSIELNDDIDLPDNAAAVDRSHNADELLEAFGSEDVASEAEESLDYSAAQADADALLEDDDIILSYTQGTMELDINLDLLKEDDQKREAEMESRRIRNLVDDGDEEVVADLTASSLQAEVSLFEEALQDEADDVVEVEVSLPQEEPVVEIEAFDDVAVDEEFDELSASQQWLGQLRSNLAGSDDDANEVYLDTDKLDDAAGYTNMATNTADNIEADLETAMAYIGNGFYEDAKPLLGKVIVHGNGDQRETASRLLDEINGDSAAGHVA